MNYILSCKHLFVQVPIIYPRLPNIENQADIVNLNIQFSFEISMNLQNKHRTHISYHNNIETEPKAKNTCDKT